MWAIYRVDPVAGTPLPHWHTTQAPLFRNAIWLVCLPIRTFVSSVFESQPQFQTNPVLRRQAFQSQPDTACGLLSPPKVSRHSFAFLLLPWVSQMHQSNWSPNSGLEFKQGRVGASSTEWASLASSPNANGWFGTKGTIQGRPLGCVCLFARIDSSDSQPPSNGVHLGCPASLWQTNLPVESFFCKQEFQPIKVEPSDVPIDCPCCRSQ